MFKKKGKPKKTGKKTSQDEDPENQFRRVFLPRGKQSFGILDRRLGASRMSVRCLDGKTRICRIPGRLKRHLWVREGDIVVVEPWELSGDDKGDIIHKYTKAQVSFLRNKGYLKKLESLEEF